MIYAKTKYCMLEMHIENISLAQGN
jgi:hypothetical protein